MEELVSIVIPTYNRADLLQEAIDSALRQTYPYKEVIVIDDGSTDNTKEICDKYGEKIRYIYKENGGIASALNKGISEMRGVWFKWLSSDDVLEDNVVEELVKFAHENNAKFIYSDYIIIDDQGRQIGEFIEPTYDTYLDFASKLWQYFIGNGSSSLIHRSIFEKVGVFDTSLKNAEDYDFWLRVCILHGIMLYRCPKVMLRYRVHLGQLTAEVRPEALQYNMRIQDLMKKQYIKLYGKKNWNKLMKEFKKRGTIRPLWRRVGRKFLTFMPKGIAGSLVNFYKRMHEG